MGYFNQQLILSWPKKVHTAVGRVGQNGPLGSAMFERRIPPFGLKFTLYGFSRTQTHFFGCNGFIFVSFYYHFGSLNVVCHSVHVSNQLNSVIATNRQRFLANWTLNGLNSFVQVCYCHQVLSTCTARYDLSLKSWQFLHPHQSLRLIWLTPKFPNFVILAKNT